MFQFFKKPGQRDRPRLLHASPTKSTQLGKTFADEYGDDCASIYLPSSTLCSLEEEEEDDIVKEDKDNKRPFRSQLSKTLPEILADKDALGYFIQFMDTRHSIALIKFWLEVECLCESFPNFHLSNENVENFNLKNDCTTTTIATTTTTTTTTITTMESSSLSNSLDDNDNFNCNVLQGNIENDVREKGLYNEIVNTNDVKSNCNDTPKINEMLSGMRQLNRKLENDRGGDMTNTRQDALRIYKKYIIKETLGTNRIPEEVKLDIENALKCKNIEPILRCLSNIQNIIFDVIEKEYINDFLRSEFHCKHQIDVLTSGNVQLGDILYNETAFFYFMEFMELENKRELLDFWMAAINYKQNLLEKKDPINPEEAQSDALIIYDKYFSLQATTPLGFNDKIRFEVEENICREDGEGPLPDCFDKPCKIVYKFLNKHYLPTFLSSQLYYKYLSELISTIQSNPCSNYQLRIKRAGSDCSSEVSSISNSMQSTLQAGNNANGILSNTSTSTKTSAHNNMNIDTRQLYDPDSLWRRNKYRLSVGYIDYLGRFITEIEPDPCRKYESRLARAVKRLVNLEQDKAKEELAWKIAEMIIRDITSLTLGATNHPS
ncbi:PREDICTED: A-kinase anchor protein 10, mitochondrial [Polistes canadensis]|uniref:A-kinase anchor protein 10, mitochondrial n=1 Tax=Polistes canadensis TaxID=91411 RepID=UPI000718DDA6|nr:PREDICTED: A-kinase anchor protein 10, mitochondrial [Polistes canadensis]